MTDETANLILEHLRRMRLSIDRTEENMLEVKQRLGHLESQYATISNRMDRVDLRLDRIEKRLDLVEV
jgi:predicted  nucleic acid-binding Zn-ribbon protein